SSTTSSTTIGTPCRIRCATCLRLRRRSGTGGWEGTSSAIVGLLSVLLLRLPAFGGVNRPAQRQVKVQALAQPLEPNAEKLRSRLKVLAAHLDELQDRHDAVLVPVVGRLARPAQPLACRGELRFLRCEVLL